MDVEKFGAFIAECRREKKMTQADLAIKLQVTDKAVSRWERSLGFPDINTIEPLANSLGLSLLEIMKSEKINNPEISNDTLVIEGLGAIFPLICVIAAIVLCAYGILRKACKKPCGQTFSLAIFLFIIPLIVLGIFFLLGVTGIGAIL